MNTATFNSNAMGNLWNYLQGLSLSAFDRHWLADRLYESLRDEDDEVMAQARKTIEEMRQQSEENGNSGMTLDEINEEIRQCRMARRQKAVPA